MTRLGKLLRKLRIDHDELLLSMAQKLGVSSAFLSSVENGKRSAPASWVDTLTKEYSLTLDAQKEFEEAIAESVKQIRIDVNNVDLDIKNCALAFARSFDKLAEEDLQRIMEIINKRRNA